MEIAKIAVPQEWQKLEELIKTQTDKSAFAFESGKTYQLQADGNFGVRLCVSAAVPEDTAGVRIVGTQTAYFKVESGTYLYVKALRGAASSTPHLDISVVGG